MASGETELADSRAMGLGSRAAARQTWRTRFFNTTAPIKPECHHHVPPLSRVDLDELLRLIDEERYFVLRAPRQTGKSTVLRALMQRLNAGGGHWCVYVNVEVAQAAREDVGAGMQAILYMLWRESAWTIGDQTVNEIWAGILERAGPYSALEAVLSEWAAADPKPLVVFFDEIDALVGNTLISVLRQLRSGYGDRPRPFPQSVVLCDVRDYRICTSTDEVVLGGSAFNIKAKSMRLGDFSEDEVRALLGQHTVETGQVFAEGALSLVCELTCGQP